MGDRAHFPSWSADQVIEETAAIYETNVFVLGAGCPNRNKQAFGGLGDNNNREPIMNKRTYLARNSYPTRAKSHWFFLVLLLLSSATTFAAPVPTVEDIIASLGLKQDQVANLGRAKLSHWKSVKQLKKNWRWVWAFICHRRPQNSWLTSRAAHWHRSTRIPWLKAMRSKIRRGRL